MLTPTELPEFEMPFWLVPDPAFVPAIGPSKFLNVNPPERIVTMGVTVGP